MMVALTGLLGIAAVLVRGMRFSVESAFPSQLAVELGRRHWCFLSHWSVLILLLWEMMLVPIYFLIAIWGSWCGWQKKNTQQLSSLFIPKRLGLLCWLGSWYWSLSATLKGWWALIIMICSVRHLAAGNIRSCCASLLALRLSCRLFLSMAGLPDAHAQAQRQVRWIWQGYWLKPPLMVWFVLSCHYFQQHHKILPRLRWLGYHWYLYGAWLRLYANRYEAFACLYQYFAHGFVVLAIYAELY